jgi:hypothetical protein
MPHSVYYRLGMHGNSNIKKIFEKPSNIKLHDNPSSWSLVVPRGQTNMTVTVILAILRKRLETDNNGCSKYTVREL